MKEDLLDNLHQLVCRRDLAAASFALMCQFGAAQSTELVSVSSAGVQGATASSLVSMSADGRFVSFTSDASNLVPNDTNSAFDQFLRDRQTGTTVRISVSSAGVEGDQGGAGFSAISDDGRFVAFTSPSTNLDPEDTNSDTDIFLRDLLLGTTVLVSKANAPAAHDGAYPSMSGDGRFIAFTSTRILVPQDFSAGSAGDDVYVRDMALGETTLVSVATSGLAGNSTSYYTSISGDGRFVAFESAASDLVFSDTNGGRDVFVRDMATGVTSLASVNSSGVQGSGIGYAPVLSRSGRFLAFSTNSPQLIEPFTTRLMLRDLVAGTTKSVGLDSLDGFQPSVSDDGRYVAFIVGLAGPLQPDVYVRDMQSSTFDAIDVDPAGGPPNDSTFSSPTAISADGRYVAFEHFASNLVASGDSNHERDVFVRDTFEPPPPPEVWTDLGASLAGSAGTPTLAGTGPLTAGTLVTLVLSDAKPFSASTIILGVAQLNVPFKGGVMVPSPHLMFALTTDFFGNSSFGGLWPAGVPSGFTTYFQWWIQDPAGPKGFAASNALAGTTP